MSFHRRCGSRIHLSNSNRTARRNINDFNHGIVFSAEPMADDVWFHVQIDEKVCKPQPHTKLQFEFQQMNGTFILDSNMARWHGARR